jgi:Protein of unknown function (DUF2778)
MGAIATGPGQFGAIQVVAPALGVDVLAHTYMLGPNGQSNGCVSFSNYPEFLNAFRKGEVKKPSTGDLFFSGHRREEIDLTKVRSTQANSGL